ncbi:uncharacterized serine-rich protein C215.13-like [Haliotis rubra]|uniref:uncharacterized serine-rich protein C215.13-like n=1 Tax=Haliotis rubra TaxID=36100 RepID=UPI001EE5C3F1|nr:uncharacterized serine-rich protein C215.13-like [Haliotis rubra]
MNAFSLQCVLFFLLGLDFHLLGFCSIELTSVPSVATDGEPLILTCNNTEEEHDNNWFRNGDPIFVTIPSCSSLSNASILNKELFNEYLSGRVSVSCHGNQHNVTLMVDSDIDDESVWWCEVEERSNNITIRMNSSAPLLSSPSLPTTHVSTSVPTSTIPTTSTSTSPSSSSSMATSSAKHGVSSSTTTSRSTTAAKRIYPYTSVSTSTIATLEQTQTAGNKTAEEHGKEAPDVQHFYVVAGSVCGTAVGILIITAVVIMWTKSRHKQKEESAAIMQSEETNHFYINEAVQQDVDAV